MLFLLPEEVAFLKFLKEARVKPTEYEFPASKISNVQSQVSECFDRGSGPCPYRHASQHTPAHTCTHACPQLEKLVETNYYLHKSAKDGYRSYLQAYASHSLKQVRPGPVHWRWGLCPSPQVCLMAASDFRCQHLGPGQSRQGVRLQRPSQRQLG